MNTHIAFVLDRSGSMQNGGTQSTNFFGKPIS